MPEKPLFGYQMHLAVDQGSGLVRLKRCYGYRRVRYRSLVKNALQLLAVALNLRDALALTA
jgi:IS5 family transposase